MEAKTVEMQRFYEDVMLASHPYSNDAYSKQEAKSAFQRLRRARMEPKIWLELFDTCCRADPTHGWNLGLPYLPAEESLYTRKKFSQRMDALEAFWNNSVFESAKLRLFSSGMLHADQLSPHRNWFENGYKSEISCRYHKEYLSKKVDGWTVRKSFWHPFNLSEKIRRLCAIRLTVDPLIPWPYEPEGCWWISLRDALFVYMRCEPLGEDFSEIFKSIHLRFRRSSFGELQGVLNYLTLDGWEKDKDGKIDMPASRLVGIRLLDPINHPENHDFTCMGREKSFYDECLAVMMSNHDTDEQAAYIYGLPGGPEQINPDYHEEYRKIFEASKK